MMFDIAGTAISGINLLLKLRDEYKDLNHWEEADLPVDFDWLTEAIEAKLLHGTEDQFAWMRENRVPTAELRHTHSTVIAFNSERRIKYRIVMGYGADRLILVQKLQLGRPSS
jgi:hypothetical protein